MPPSLARATVAIAAVTILSVVVAVAFWRKQRAFKRLFIVLWVLLLAFSLLDPVCLSILFDVPIEASLDHSAISTIAGNVFFGVWIAYILRSRRVAETFVR